jgi:hypothetical protein
VAETIRQRLEKLSDSGQMMESEDKTDVNVNSTDRTRQAARIGLRFVYHGFTSEGKCTLIHSRGH